MKPPSFPWTNATNHCWHHVETVSNVQKVIDTLQHIDVESVTPIISSIGPALIIVPFNHGDEKAVRSFAKTIKSLVDGNGAYDWKVVAMGDSWSLRMTTASGVVVTISTTVPVAKPQEFTL